MYRWFFPGNYQPSSCWCSSQRKVRAARRGRLLPSNSKKKVALQLLFTVPTFNVPLLGFKWFPSPSKSLNSIRVCARASNRSEAVLDNSAESGWNFPSNKLIYIVINATWEPCWQMQTRLIAGTAEIAPFRRASKNTVDSSCAHNLQQSRWFFKEKVNALSTVWYLSRYCRGTWVRAAVPVHTPTNLRMSEWPLEEDLVMCALGLVWWWSGLTTCLWTYLIPWSYCEAFISHTTKQANTWVTKWLSMLIPHPDVQHLQGCGSPQHTGQMSLEGRREAL